MRYLIPAAGRGTRISADIHGQAKCLLEIAPGTTLIGNTLGLLRSRGVAPEDIVVIVGYEAAAVRAEVERFGVTVVDNPFFDVTNSIASLWFARGHLAEDFVVLNGDICFEPAVLDRLLTAPGDLVMLGDSSRVVEADYRFAWADGRLLEHGKGLPPSRTTGEYVGLARVRGPAAAAFRERLAVLVGQQEHGLWWENVAYRLNQGAWPVRVVDVVGLFWGEVDHLADYQRICAYMHQR